MPTYFFHLADHVTAPDDEGVELPDPVAARREAVSFAGSLLRDDPDIIWDGRDLRVQVEDESGQHICTVVMLAVDAVSLARNQSS